MRVSLCALVLQPTADALWYHAPNIGGDEVANFRPPSTNPRQRIVVQSLEGEVRLRLLRHGSHRPSHARALQGNYGSITRTTHIMEEQYEQLQDKSLHGIVMNYRFDAHVPSIYGFFNDLTKPLPFHDKKNRVLYMQSNCVGFRDGYVRELMNHYPVDAGGTCLHNADVRKSRAEYYLNVNVYMEYKFAVTFENSVSDYYVTERVYHALEAGTLPIYFGAPNADLMLPERSVIFAADFPNPKDLADYLKRLESDQALYDSYHEWRKQPKLHPNLMRVLNVGHQGPECRLRIKLLHQCDRNCPCGGKQVVKEKYYDGKVWGT